MKREQIISPRVEIAEKIHEELLTSLELERKLLKKELTLQESIEAPRIHLEGDELYYEPGINISENNLLEHLSLHPFEKKNLFFGGVNAVTLSDGFSDSRRGGTFEIV